MYRPGVLKGEGNDRIDTPATLCDKGGGSLRHTKGAGMIKILLLVGGVWFFLALLFVGALFAAYSKSLPKRGSKPVMKTQSHVPRPTTRAASARPTARRKVDWEMEKPVEA